MLRPACFTTTPGSRTTLNVGGRRHQRHDVEIYHTYIRTSRWYKGQVLYCISTYIPSAHPSLSQIRARARARVRRAAEQQRPVFSFCAAVQLHTHKVPRSICSLSISSLRRNMPSPRYILLTPIQPVAVRRCTQSLPRPWLLCNYALLTHHRPPTTHLLLHSISSCRDLPPPPSRDLTSKSTPSSSHLVSCALGPAAKRVPERSDEQHVRCTVQSQVGTYKAHKRAAISSSDSPLSRARFDLHPASTRRPEPVPHTRRTASCMTTAPPVPILPASPIILRPLQSVRCVDPMCRSSPSRPRNAETTFCLHSCLIISPSRFSAESRVLLFARGGCPGRAARVILSMPACMRLARRPDMHLGKPLTHASARLQCPILGLPPATLPESRFSTWTADADSAFHAEDGARRLDQTKATAEAAPTKYGYQKM